MENFLLRFFKKLEKSEACWFWKNNLTENGYGRFYYKGKVLLAHRWAYEFYKGPIPKELELDHLCRNRNCVNPDHLEPVSRKENVKRGLGPLLAKKRQEDKTMCPVGHPYSEENTSVYIKKNGKPNRRCKICHCDREAKRRQNNKEKVNGF